MHPPQKAKCMNQECQKKCTMRRGPAFLQCSHFFCTVCYNEPGFDRTCRLCSPQISKIIQPKTSRSNSKKLVGRNNSASTEKKKTYVQQLETLEEETDDEVLKKEDLKIYAEEEDSKTHAEEDLKIQPEEEYLIIHAKEEDSKIHAEDIFTVENEDFEDGNAITKVENVFHNIKEKQESEILHDTDIENNKEDIIDKKEQRKKIKMMSSKIRELANLDLNIPSDYVIYTHLRGENLRIMDVQKYFRKCVPAKFSERYKKVEQFGNLLNEKKDKCEEAVRNLARTLIDSCEQLAEDFKKTVEVDINETDTTDYKQWRVENFFAKLPASPEPIENSEYVNKEYHEKKEAITKKEEVKRVINTFKTPTRSKHLGPPIGGGNWKVQKPIIEKPLLENQSPGVTKTNASEMMFIPKKETQKTWRDDLYTEDDPQPQSELDKHLFEVNWCLTQKFKKDLLSKKGKEESLMIIAKLIGNMTIYENCRKLAIEAFENNFNVKLPIIQTVQ